jgi:hypothetical protein
MKKLKLEDLSVESFESAGKAIARGTVVGNSGDNTCYFCNQTDDDYTCWYGCVHTGSPANTCFDTCAGAPGNNHCYL